MTLYHVERLKDVELKLIELIIEVGKEHDVIIVCGRRDKEAQNLAFSKGLSDYKFPRSAHNKPISLAIDVAPYDSKTNKIIWDFGICKTLRTLIDLKAVELKIGIKELIPVDCLHIELSI